MHYTATEQDSAPVWLQFGMLWLWKHACSGLLEQPGQGRRSPPKALAPAAAGLGNRPGNRDSCGAEEGELILGWELGMGDGGDVVT